MNAVVSVTVDVVRVCAATGTVTKVVPCEAGADVGDAVGTDGKSTPKNAAPNQHVLGLHDNVFPPDANAQIVSWSPEFKYTWTLAWM